MSITEISDNEDFEVSSDQLIPLLISQDVDDQSGRRSSNSNTLKKRNGHHVRFELKI